MPPGRLREGRYPRFRNALLRSALAKGSSQRSLIVTAGVLVNLAAIGKRYLIVLPSQTHGTLLPYGAGSYSPTWVEYSVIVGLFALGTLAYMLFVKVFPIMEVEKNRERG